MTDSLVELSYYTKFRKGINIMVQLNSTTFTPDRQRGQQLKFEDRCSIRIFNKLCYSLRKTAENYWLLRFYSSKRAPQGCRKAQWLKRA